MYKTFLFNDTPNIYNRGLYTHYRSLDILIHPKQFLAVVQVRLFQGIGNLLQWNFRIYSIVVEDTHWMIPPEINNFLIYLIRLHASNEWILNHDIFLNMKKVIVYIDIKTYLDISKIHSSFIHTKIRMISHYPEFYSYFIFVFLDAWHNSNKWLSFMSIPK